MDMAAAIPSPAAKLRDSDDMVRLAAEQSAREATERQRRLTNAGQRGDVRWYVVQCAKRSDKAVCDWLDYLKFENYYPMVREMRPVPKRKLTKSQRDREMIIMRPQIIPFLPRYVFVRFDMLNGAWREIFEHVGVIGMHCAGDLPAPIDATLIVRLKSRERADGVIPGGTEAKHIFAVGESVEVLDGPFASFRGTVEKLANVAIEEIDPDTRIKVALNIFGRLTPVELEVNQVAKV